MRASATPSEIRTCTRRFRLLFRLEVLANVVKRLHQEPAVFGCELELPRLEDRWLQVNAAVCGWRMEGRHGTGAYELALRDEGPEAA